MASADASGLRNAPLFTPMLFATLFPAAACAKRQRVYSGADMPRLMPLFRAAKMPPIIFRRQRYACRR